MPKTIAYYHPRKILEESNRASDIRVSKMLNAFRDIGYDVRVIAGSPKERRQAIRNFKNEVKSGLRIDFVYGECTNAPVALAEKKPWPSLFIADYLFFRWLQKNNIPSGIFYRDIYWRFDFFDQQLPWPLNYLLKPLYFLDWSLYNRYWPMMFLPTESMNDHLPRPRPQGTYSPLPPGYVSTQRPRPVIEREGRELLNLLYVGGLEPTVYDITSLLSLVNRHQNTRLTICCREEEWNKYQHYYAEGLSRRVQIVHASRTELENHYHQADLFLMLMPQTTYMDFAMPVKFFESIGYAVPIVSMNQASVAHLVREHGIGWVIETVSELDKLIQAVGANRDQIFNMQHNIMMFRAKCTWEARAGQAASILLKENAELQ